MGPENIEHRAKNCQHLCKHPWFPASSNLIRNDVIESDYPWFLQPRESSVQGRGKTFGETQVAAGGFATMQHGCSDAGSRWLESSGSLKAKWKTHRGPLLRSGIPRLVGSYQWPLPACFQVETCRKWLIMLITPGWTSPAPTAAAQSVSAPAVAPALRTAPAVGSQGN